MGLGIGELALILVIVLIIFGAGKLPDIGDGLGRSIRSFRKAVKMPDSIDVTEDSADNPPPKESESESKP